MDKDTLEDRLVFLPPFALRRSDWEYVKGALDERDVTFDEFLTEALVEAAHR